MKLVDKKLRFLFEWKRKRKNKMTTGNKYVGGPEVTWQRMKKTEKENRLNERKRIEKGKWVFKKWIAWISRHKRKDGIILVVSKSDENFKKKE